MGGAERGPLFRWNCISLLSPKRNCCPNHPGDSKKFGWYPPPKTVVSRKEAQLPRNKKLGPQIKISFLSGPNLKQRKRYESKSSPSGIPGQSSHAYIELGMVQRGPVRQMAPTTDVQQILTHKIPGGKLYLCTNNPI